MVPPRSPPPTTAARVVGRIRLVRPRPARPDPDRAGAVIEELGSHHGSVAPSPVAGEARPRASVSWPRSAWAATVTASDRAPVRLLGLLAFLSRGGILVLALPIWVVPTVIGIANWVGPTSVTAAGPTWRLVLLVAGAVAVAAGAVLAGTLVGGAAEAALHRAAAAPDADDPEAGVASVGPGARGASGAFRVAAIRLVLFVPVALAVALAVVPLVEAGYREVTFPSDLRTPLLVRIFLGAPAASASVVAAWLLGEVVGGLATRRAILFDRSVVPALGGAVLDVLRRPISTLLTLAAGIVVSAVLIVPGMIASAIAWEQAQRSIGEGTGSGTALLVATTLAACWLGTLVLAGLAAAWRATLWTGEVLRAEGIRPPNA